MTNTLRSTFSCPLNTWPIGDRRAGTTGRPVKIRGILNVLLAVTSHIANGSKHFIADRLHHRSVSHVDAPPDWIEPGRVQPDWVETGELLITLEGFGRHKLGANLRVRNLADQILEFWESDLTARLGLSPAQ